MHMMQELKTMRRNNFSAATRSLRRKVKKHSPAILTALGISGFVATTITAVKVTPKAMEDIESKKKSEGKEKLTKKETVQVVWKHYAMPTAMGVASASCIICANSIHNKRNAAIAAAYTIGERALADYKESTKEIVGEKKQDKIEKNIAEKKMQEHPIGNKELVSFNPEKTIFFDPLSGRYFRGSIAGFNSILNKINAEILRDPTYSLNEFYGEVGLPPNDMGETHGWNFLDDGLIEIDLDFVEEKDPNSKYCGEVIGSLRYRNPPKYNFDKLF